jgi:tetratricopeptide (TPR) repeat protein
MYELLTLQLPFTGEDRQELLRQIAFEEPKAPKRLNKAIPAELNTIVLKAIEKNPEERYATAQELADDLERFLRDEPIRAKRPSLVQRARKWGRRHPSVARSALVVTFLALAATGFIMWREKHWTEQAFNEVSAEQKKTQAALERAETNEKQANAERRRAEERKRIAEAVGNFLQQKLLLQADTRQQADALLRAGKPSTKAKLNPTIRELLDRAAAELTPERIEANFPDQPLVQAEILKTVGRTYWGVGDYRPAIAHLTRCRELCEAQLGPDHPDTLRTFNDLALVYQYAGSLTEAIRLYEQVRENFEQKLGPDHPDTLTMLNNLALAYQNAGRLVHAIHLYEQVRENFEQELGPDHPDTLRTLDNLASAYQAAGRLQEAIRLFEHVRQKREQKLGPDHPDTLGTTTNLATS